jgi:hypothetical protein
VIGFDPGGTTGWCVVEYRPDAPHCPPIILASGQCETWKIVPYLFETYEKSKPEWGQPICIAEDFRLRKKEGPSLVGDQFIACKVIGVIEYVAERADVPVVLRPAANKAFFESVEVEQSRKRLLTLPYLPEDYLKHTHKWRHVLDAINHTLHYLHFDRKIAYR